MLREHDHSLPGVHGLREEVQEKQRFKAVLEARDEEVRRLVSQRNTREAQLSDLAEEVSWLREKLGISPEDRTGIDLKELRLKGQVELDRLRAMVQQYEDEVFELERERERLNKKLRVKALNRGERAAMIGISVEKLTALEEMEAQLDKDYAFEGERVGAARLQHGRQRDGEPPPLTLEFAGVKDVRVLQQRGSAVQAELAKQTEALQAAEAAKRKLEREKASLLQACHPLL